MQIHRYRKYNILRRTNRKESITRYFVVELQNTNNVLKSGRKGITYKGMTIRRSRLLQSMHCTYYIPTLAQVLRTQDEQARLSPYTVEPTSVSGTTDVEGAMAV